MNYIYPHSNPKILKLGIRMALYREKEPDYNNINDDTVLSTAKWQQSRIAYLKEPEFKDRDVIYHLKTGEELIIDGSIHKGFQEECSHYYPGQQVESSFKYVREEEIYDDEFNWPIKVWQEVEEPERPSAKDAKINDNEEWVLVETASKLLVALNKKVKLYTQFQADKDKGKILAEI